MRSGGPCQSRTQRLCSVAVPNIPDDARTPTEQTYPTRARSFSGRSSTQLRYGVTKSWRRVQYCFHDYEILPDQTSIATRLFASSTFQSRASHE